MKYNMHPWKFSKASHVSIQGKKINVWRSIITSLRGLCGVTLFPARLAVSGKAIAAGAVQPEQQGDEQ